MDTLGDTGNLFVFIVAAAELVRSRSPSTPSTPAGTEKYKRKAEEQNARSRPDTTGNDGSGAYWRNANKRDDGSDGRAYGFGNG